MESGKEIMITDDLRKKRFRMTDKMHALDFHHLNLLVNELARMHAGGYLTMRESSFENLVSQFPIIKKDALITDDDDHFGMKMFGEVMQTHFDVAIKLLEIFPWYQNVSERIKGWKSNWKSLFKNRISDTPDAFKVFAHGDCWNNNFLFR